MPSLSASPDTTPTPDVSEAATPSTMRDRVSEFRNRLLQSARFQRFAAAFPLTRPVARASAKSLFGLCTGFVYTQVITACVQLDLFRRLDGRPMEVSELARHVSMPDEGLDRLVRAAVSLKLLEWRSGGRIGVGVQGAALLGNPSVMDMIRHHQLLYRDLADPLERLRNRSTETELAAYWGYAGREDPDALPSDTTDDYSGLMASTQAFVAEDVLAAYAFHRHNRLLDIGGGAGVFARAAVSHCPDLQATVFDLPSVADLANRRFKADGLDDRLCAVGGDAFRSSLPEGQDIISLVRILHDHDDGPVRTLLRACRNALPPGGRLLIAEPLAETPGSEAMGDAYFGLYLWCMGSGRPRSAAELTGMLQDAGFRSIKERSTRQPLLVRVLVAE